MSECRRQSFNGTGGVNAGLTKPNMRICGTRREERTENGAQGSHLWTNNLLSNVPLLFILFSPDAFSANYVIVQIRPISRSIYTRRVDFSIEFLKMISLPRPFI